MPTVITCPTPDCGRQLRVPDELLGKKVKCPSCGNVFTATAEESAPPPPVEEEEEERPVKRKAARRDDDDDEEERRPIRRRDDDDEDDEDRPRRKRRRHMQPHRGQLILILGILSFFVAGPILGPIAWIMGNTDLKEMRAGRMDPEGEGNTNAGRICGMISTILSIIGLVCCVIYFVVVIGIIGAAGAGNARF